MKKILLIGNYGAGNLGDEAILESLIGITKEYGYDPVVMSANPDETRARYKIPAVRPLSAGVRSFFKGGKNETMKYINECDAAILGGGGLFTDERIMAPLIWARQARGVINAGKPLFCVGQSIGPLRTKIGKHLTKWVFSRAKFITVRDTASKKILEDLEIDPKKIIVGSDLAILHPSLPSVPKHKRKVIVSIRSWKKKQHNLKNALLNILPDIADEVILLAMGDNDEQLLSDFRLMLPMPSCQVQVIRPEDPHDVLRIVNGADLMIGMRLHSIILASVQGVKSVAISYSDKVERFCRSANINWLALDSLTEKKLRNSIEKASLDEDRLFGLYDKTVESVQKVFEEINAG